MNIVTLREMLSLLISSFSLTLPAQTSHPQIPPRVAEEAESLAQNATRILTRETLAQRSLLPPTRFRPRAGSPAERAIGPRFRIREVVSEFSFGALRSPSPTTSSSSAKSSPSTASPSNRPTMPSAPCPKASTRATTAPASVCWKSSPATAWSISPPITR